MDSAVVVVGWGLETYLRMRAMMREGTNCTNVLTNFIKPVVTNSVLYLQCRKEVEIRLIKAINQ